jgi:hypothetical protein
LLERSDGIRAGTFTPGGVADDDEEPVRLFTAEGRCAQSHGEFVLAGREFRSGTGGHVRNFDDDGL